jgi:hypothetical protein
MLHDKGFGIWLDTRYDAKSKAHIGPKAYGQLSHLRSAVCAEGSCSYPFSYDPDTTVIKRKQIKMKRVEYL